MPLEYSNYRYAIGVDFHISLRSPPHWRDPTGVWLLSVLLNAI
jgi:hypothetical protein